MKEKYINFAIIYTRSAIEAAIIMVELKLWIDTDKDLAVRVGSWIYFYTKDVLHLFTVDIVLEYKMYNKTNCKHEIKDGWLYLTNHYS